MKYSEAVLREGFHLPHGAHRGVFANADGDYGCHSCGATWKAEPVYLKWPISFGWAHRCRAFFTRWGVQIGAEAIERPVFATIIAIGWLRIRFGLERHADRDCARQAPPSAAS